jgi:hypothetical protein
MELGTSLKHKAGVLRAMKKMNIGFRVSGGTYQSEQAIIEVMCESKDGLEIYEQMLDLALEEVNKKTN